jgi:hypothetical protein
MPQGLPHTAKEHIDKALAAATAAVEAYNRPGRRFRTAHYIVLIIMAWTAVLHAAFYRRNRRPWYSRGAGRGTRYVRIDGEPKHWDLDQCLRQFYGDRNPPERQNLRFLIGLRNKIEHRHLPELDAGLYGECQAALMNLEDFLVSEFGSRWSISEDLAVSLQFSRVIPTAKRTALRRMAASSSKSVRDYIEKFRGGLAPNILNSSKYSFSVYLVPKTANRASAADAAVEFIPYDESKPEEMARIEKLTTLIKEKLIPVANLDLLKPGEVVDELRVRLPFRITPHTHTQAWRYYQLRPAHGAAQPEKTKQEYCIFDHAHQDYLYTRAWVELLARDLADPVRFEAVTGKPPVSRS